MKVSPQASRQPVASPAPLLKVRNLCLELEGRSILDQVRLDLPCRGVTALIGPSGAGKSSLLRCLNLLCDHWQGEIVIGERSVRKWPGGADALRRHVGLIGQKPVVFPGSIRRNLLFGLGRRERKVVPLSRIEKGLSSAGLWEEVRDRLDSSAGGLSLGQQQRLCIARALMLQPGLLLVDEPTSSLDPQGCHIIEETLLALARHLPVLWVTHDLAQAQRVADQVIFICQGSVVEQAPAMEFFTRPKRLETREFLRWNVCECDG